MKAGLVCQKKEMTKLWIDDALVPVTILMVLPQEIRRYKTQEADGYDALVVGVSKQEKNGKATYQQTCEFHCDDNCKESFKAGDQLTAAVLDGVERVIVKGVSKGKGYQGAMKRFNLGGGPKTHGSKFHRQVGSLGNRKPRRVQKGHPHAGHMGTDAITLHRRPVLKIQQNGPETLVFIKGSVPGSYNALVQLVVTQ